MSAYSEPERIDFALGQLQGVKNLLLALYECHPDRVRLAAAFQRNAEMAAANLLPSPASQAWIEGHAHIVDAVNRLEALLAARNSS